MRAHESVTDISPEVEKAKEAPEERFTRVAEARVNAVLDKLKLLGQCANRKNYAYTKGQTDAILRALSAEVRTLKSKFETGNTEARRFRL